MKRDMVCVQLLLHCLESGFHLEFCKDIAKHFKCVLNGSLVHTMYSRF